ncbi:recombinase family protein [Rossellomorea vietnamensis]|uniref:Recombinase family protein n=1 Tax=Rossellomorea vietnamensis TaxID=218284 RepID=A0A5D4NUY2_9BACI|nr:recombinase family protein [Rossellomorea vietnamensis]TYS18047.1 recombinase family protein [Rossellomorea vietnamensis]
MQNYAMNLLEQLDHNPQAGTQKRASIYARVSTVEQAEEGYSIDEQINVLRQWCEQEGYVIHKEYVDRGISGKNIRGRPAIQELLHDANQKCFDVVLVWKLNRLSRKSVDLLNIVEILQNKGIGFRSHTERYETETPTGRLLFQMMAAVAEFERANIAENVKMGMLARAREGSWNGGQVLGYDVVSIPSDNRKRKISKLFINEKEAQTVKRIFELYTGGHGYKAIANTVNKEGHRSKKENTFSISAIRTILTNPIYVGFIRYNVRQDWSEKRRNNINPNPVIEKGLHEPIISEETWEKAQAILKSRSKTPNRVHSGEYPLTGVMKCPACGAGMVLGRTTNTNKDGSKRVLEYYVCGAWKNKGTAACRSNGIRTEYADKYVLDKIGGLATNDKLMRDVVAKVNGGLNEKTSPLQKEYKVLKKSLSEIESKKDKVLGLYEDGVIEKVDLVERLEKLNVEKKLTEERLSPLELQLSGQNQINVDYELVKEVMSNFVSNYKKTITTEQKKRLLHLLIKEIRIGESREINSIQIQLNNEVVRHFTKQGEEKSSSEDDFSSPFSILIDL